MLPRVSFQKSFVLALTAGILLFSGDSHRFFSPAQIPAAEQPAPNTLNKLATEKPASEKPAEKVQLLFDFEGPAALKDWTNLELPEPKYKEPPVRIEIAEQPAGSGNHALKLTYAGGSWPTVISKAVPEDWNPYHTITADVTVTRRCIVGFTIFQEQSKRGEGWDPGVSRCTKTAFLEPGKNVIQGNLHPHDWSAILPKFGKVVSLEIFMYLPHENETIFVDNIRITESKLPQTKDTTQFEVLGLPEKVASVQELGKKLEKDWVKPTEKTLAELETALDQQFQQIKKAHPGAVKVVFRDGESGFDPAHPEQVYAGWKDAYWSSHGPDSLFRDRAENIGKNESHEVFMRHRSPLMRIDLSSIPAGSRILAARLVLIRGSQPVKEHDPFAKPSLWVAEPCNRPWEETEVNAFQYARDKFWKEIGGRSYDDDPDFLPIFLAYGSGQGMVSDWDFTRAVDWWTRGQHPNHGFMLHGDSKDWLGRCWSREAKELKNRPALYVIYAPQ